MAVSHISKLLLQLLIDSLVCNACPLLYVSRSQYIGHCVCWIQRKGIRLCSQITSVHTILYLIGRPSTHGCVELVFIHVSIGETNTILSVEIHIVTRRCIVSYDFALLVLLYLRLRRLLVSGFTLYVLHEMYNLIHYNEIVCGWVIGVWCNEDCGSVNRLTYEEDGITGRNHLDTERNNNCYVDSYKLTVVDSWVSKSCGVD